MTSITSLSRAESLDDVAATTASGEKVVLHPNGRWEFLDVQKQAVAKKVADQFPENKPNMACPPGAQGGYFGGRCLLPGDRDYRTPKR